MLRRIAILNFRLNPVECPLSSCATTARSQLASGLERLCKDGGEFSPKLLPYWPIGANEVRNCLRGEKLDSQSLLRIAKNLVAHVTVPFQSAAIHSSQHEHIAIDIVIDFNHSLSVMQAV